MAFRSYIVLFLLLAVVPLSAANVYTDSSAFTSLLAPGYYVETFDGIGDGPIGATHTFPAGSYTFSAYAAGELWSQVSAGSRALSTEYAADPLVFTFTGSPTAVGGNFFSSDVDFSVIPGTITLTLDDGTTTTVTVTNPNSALPFIGFTATGGAHITTLTVTGGPDTVWPTVDNLHIGQLASASEVPEPASLALLGGGFLGMALVRRRIQAARARN
jgi:hypothetical protein